MISPATSGCCRNLGGSPCRVVGPTMAIQLVGLPPTPCWQAAFLSGCAPLAHPHPRVTHCAVGWYSTADLLFGVISPSLFPSMDDPQGSGAGVGTAPGHVPLVGGPTRCTSGAPCCSEIPYRFSLGPQGTQLPCVAPWRHCRSLDDGEAMYWQGRLTPSCFLFRRKASQRY